jgi:hypothetical protein
MIGEYGNSCKYQKTECPLDCMVFRAGWFMRAL